ncbi:MAG: nickel-type superoxide dismutase maturation protease [Candidatus Aenigmarchaeota archaeon]|nr:nickel-type superoxide dismutase maturation protease [Candidatus Aenigmarchaeota archaeon]
MLKLAVVSGNSMEPTLREGQKILISKIGTPKKGDIVVLKHPYKNINIVKRVAAANESGYLVEGDNTGESTDSRHYGTIGKENLVGKVLFPYLSGRRR